MKPFKPAKGLSNRHLQSILSSSGPRKILEKGRAKQLLKTTKQHIITTPQGVNLLGFLSKTKQKTKGLAIILHGWEGCADSLYVLSSGQRLLDDGFDVFRLNFRDHGDSHHLNKDLFNSTLLQEVVEAVKLLCKEFGGKHNVLCGYSLGGNFCLRVANLAKQEQLALHQAIAICPLLHPPTTMDMLNSGFPVYEKYFVKKWKRSLFKKLQHHNHFNYGDALKKLTTLDQMNELFVKGYTPFTTTNDYFEAYSILGDGLQKLAIPTTIVTSLDDPIIPAKQFNSLFHSPWLTIEVQEHGGHCAFIKNWKFESWATDRISELVATGG
ncbi:alpha/beta hydrolase [Psychromonas marina]|uniref:Alpha/beta hydrolase n=1 Tax=Psychromonas marina TaxID=88364 RepID=A0ABQ6DYG0_9GAMM|nr:alpha/beta fold hydrolase [Psychromonas marina]GLS90137.1 alpha/beta hydrolase [Psychromonas marina]